MVSKDMNGKVEDIFCPPFSEAGIATNPRNALATCSERKGFVLVIETGGLKIAPPAPIPTVDPEAEELHVLCLTNIHTSQPSSLSGAPGYLKKWQSHRTKGHHFLFSSILKLSVRPNRNIFSPTATTWRGRQTKKKSMNIIFVNLLLCWSWRARQAMEAGDKQQSDEICLCHVRFH